MFSEFFKFEFKSRLRQPMTYIFLLINFLLILGAICSDNVSVGGSTGNVNGNSPHSVMFYTGMMSFIFGVLMTAAFMDTAARRDFSTKFDGILFATPLKKFDYLLGRFSGATLAACIPMLGVLLAVFVSGFTPWLDAEEIGPNYLMAYINAFIIFILPNTLLAAAIIFALAALFRNSIVSFIGAFALVVAYVVAGNFTSDLDNEQLAMLLDPFGISTYQTMTKYWTVDDRNHQIFGLSGMMLWNRLLWLSVSALVFLLTYFRFSFTQKKRKKRKQTTSASPEMRTIFGQSVALPSVQIKDTTSTYVSQFLNQIRLEFWGILKSAAFIVIIVLGIFNMWSAIDSSDTWFGTGNLPVTYVVVDAIRSSLYIFLIAIVTFYSGLLVWRERDAKMNEFFDASPFPSWVPFLAKYVAMLGITAIVLGLGILIGIIVQAFKGYTNFELGLYIKELLVIDFVGFAILIALAMFLQVLVNNKYLGYFAFIAFTVANLFVWNALEISNNLFMFGATPDYVYSDMNQIQPFAKGLAWFNVYWLFFAALLLVGAILLWVRGKSLTFDNRLSIARWRFDKRMALVTILLGVLWLGTGSFLYYNTTVINEITERDTRLKRQQDYEDKYKKYQNIPQPRITDIEYKIDIYPAERDFLAEAALVVKNKSKQAIQELHFTMPVDYKTAIEIEGASLKLDDDELNYRIYELATPLDTNATLAINIKSNYYSKGIENEVTLTEVVQNGTFVNNKSFMPVIGYSSDYEIAEKKERRTRSMSQRDPMKKLTHNCSAACNNTYLSSDSDWVNVSSVLSTSSDQIAIAPGSLIKEWEENGRRYFEYKLSKKVLNFYSFISADYEVAREKWNDVDLEVYYHKGHEYNVDKMMKSMRNSLNYYSDNFLPYPHHQARIIEFPRYASFAQAFPGTMPYSESIGFIADLESEDAIDGVYYVVAHEMAHQWWAHQIIGAEVQGATMLSETFSQYSALMVMEKEYGKDKMKQFLEYEMDRYLRRRSGERNREMPLMYVEDQGYVHYRKGSVIMYALKEYIGEDSLNMALRRFAEDVAYQEAPYTNTLEFMDYLEEVTPDSLNYLLDDFFRKISLYSSRTTDATYKELDNGKFEVSFSVEVEKFEADSLGKETLVPLDDFIDIGIYREAEEDKEFGTPIYLERVKISEKENEFTIIVDEKPYEAGIDPRYLLIDRFPDDNMKRVTEVE